MTKGRLQHTIDYYRAALAAREVKAEQAIERAYQHTMKTIDPALDRLYDQMVDALAAGEKIPVSFLYEAQRLENIKKLISNNIGAYGEYVQAQVAQMQHFAVQLGQRAALDLLNATVPAGVSWTFGVPSAKAIANLVGATQDGSPLAALFDGFGREAAQKASDALITGLTLGNNPRIVARDVQQALGVSRARALTISRTEMLRAYRDANTETYRANSDVVAKWRWTASPSSRTCFLAGTLIQTHRGCIPIESVVIGDMVLTHKGRYRRVYETLQRPYSGEMATVKSGNDSVIATSNHPFLVEREGKLNWIEAGQIRLSDHVVRYLEGTTNVGNHALGQGAIERGVRQSDNRVSSALQKERLTGISLCDAGFAMPINAVYFENGIQSRQEEINRIAPALDAALLHIRNTQCFQAKPSILLRLGLTSETAIATSRAIEPNRLFVGADPKWLSALFAITGDSWASAFFGAILDIRPLLVENLAASFAWNVGELSHPAFLRAVNLVILAWRGCKSFIANWTGFDDVPMSLAAFSSAIQSRPFLGDAKRMAASLANHIKRWHSNISRSRMWLKMLPYISAFIATKPPVSFALPGFGDSELFAAHLAGQGDSPGRVGKLPCLATLSTAIGVLLPADIADINPSVFSALGTCALDLTPVSLNIKSFHTPIVSQHAIHVQLDTTVYNLEVEDDHSYVANNFVVHNCAMCLAMDGQEFDVSEDFESHANCRCQAIPVTRSWADILADAGIDGSDIPETSIDLPPASDWFDQQSADVQRQILGNAKYNAYADGTITLDDLVGTSYSADWGGSRYEKSLKEAIGAGAAAKYYGG